MKKIITTLIALASIPASAQYYHHYHHHYGYRGGYHGSWVAPAIIGGVIGYELTRPIIVQQPPVIVQQPPVVVQQNCTAWTETMGADGVVTKTRTCYN